MDDKPIRKQNRLTEYDYSQNGAYFVTICTAEHRCIFWKNCVGALTERPLGQYQLSPAGEVVNRIILNIPRIYPGITVEKYIVMPNHVHLLLLFQQYSDFSTADGGRSVSAPTQLAEVVKHMKGFASREIGKGIWQKGFHDHVVRNDADFRRIWTYIDENPLKWADDCYYISE